MQDVVIKRALLSVSDKAGLVELGHALAARHVELVSTGGTAKTLRDAGLQVKDISELTGFPEMMDGRVKTLHPKVHGGLLAVRDNAEHAASMKEHDIGAIDLVVVNLYPFAQTVASGATFDESIEQIDIGGPAMLRAAAKNHSSVAVISDPSQYDLLLEAISAGGFTQDERRQLALDVFRVTAQYDLAIATWLGASDSQQLPEWFGQIWSRKSALRYGENPHQKAALYIPSDPHVRGIVVLGLDASEAALAASLALAARHDLVKGFAIGRTIFGDAARGWLAGKLTDDQAVQDMATKYARLCGIWDAARAAQGEKA